MKTGADIYGINVNEMKDYKIFLIILLTSFVFFHCITGSKKLEHVELPLDVRETIEKRIEEGITPSIAIAIINQNGIQYFNFGKTSENGRDVDEHTIYEIGSISKVFTGILLAQQVLDGDLSLDDNINDYLPTDVRVLVMGDQEMTFGNLTDHTSRLPRMPNDFF